MNVFLFTAFSASFNFVYALQKFPGVLPSFFESKNVIVFGAVMLTLLYHPSLAVIPLLGENSDAVNQSNLRNLPAYDVSVSGVVKFRSLIKNGTLFVTSSSEQQTKCM